MVLALRDCNHESINWRDSQSTGSAHLLIPSHELFWEVVLLGEVQDVFHQLWEDGFELFEGGSLCHLDQNYQSDIIERR
jgi:hypothetical protein